MSQNESFIERYRRIKGELKNSPDYAKRQYARKIRIVVAVLLFIPIGFGMVEVLKAYGEDSTILKIVVMALILVLSQYIANKIADKKFRPK